MAIRDNELVARFIQGEDVAFVEIRKHYADPVFTVGLRLLQNRTDAEEMSQEVFVKIYRGLKRFRGDATLGTWIKHIAVNCAYYRLIYQKRRRKESHISLDEELDPAQVGGTSQRVTSTVGECITDDTDDPLQILLMREFEEYIEECVAKIEGPPGDAVRIYLSTRLPYDELAQLLCIKVGTVKSRLSKGRQNLQALVAKKYPEFREKRRLTAMRNIHHPSRFIAAA